MFAVGALAIGVVCGWLSMLLGKGSRPVFSISTFFVAVGLCLATATPAATQPIVEGALIGLVVHAIWRQVLAAATRSGGERSNDG
jgi:hypothetical protein